MNEANPYAAPASDPTHPDALGRRAFPEMATKELKNLRNDSHSIRAFAFLIILAVCLLLGILGFMVANSGDDVIGLDASLFLIQASFLVFSLVTAVGLIKRAFWGRIMGYVSSALLLLAFPIGTLIAVLCLISLARGARLFGPNKLIHRELETEWKYRKRNKVA